MPWRCPACHIQIRHNDLEEKPRPGVRYRCHICRLELTLDLVSDRLTVTELPFSSNESETVNEREGS